MELGTDDLFRANEEKEKTGSGSEIQTIGKIGVCVWGVCASEELEELKWSMRPVKNGIGVKCLFPNPPFFLV